MQMRKKLSAVLLAAGMSIAVLGMGAWASESATEASVTAEAQTEAEAAAADTSSTESTADLMQPSSATGDGKYTMYYAQMEQQIEQLLTQYSQLTEEQIQQLVKAGGASSIIAATWDGVREELGSFEGVNSYTVDETDGILTYTLDTSYADAEKVGSKVTVTYSFDTAGKADETCAWDVKETIGRSMKKAALNTLIGLGVVFLALVFLSFLIGQIHWIPDILEGKKKEKEAAQAAAPVRTIEPAAAPAPAAESAEETDDLELIAVISAAIAASENAPADGFVVRSIRRRGSRNNWRRA